MKNILGLDLGTNSIGWALLQTDDDGHYQRNIRLGSRIIPMTQDVLSNFEGGKPIETQTAARTQKRGMRRLYERRALRRERLLRVLHILNFLPTHFDRSIGWDRRNNKTFGKFIDVAAEPKIAWAKDAQGKMQFIFQDSFNEMLAEFRQAQPEWVGLNAAGTCNKKIPYDWTLYYLRKKALIAPITKQELAWILLNFNQKRGYYQLRGKDDGLSQEEDKTKQEEYIEQEIVRVEVDPEEKETDKGRWYNVYLANGMVYRRQSRIPLNDWVGHKREFIVTTSLDEDGNPKKDKDGKIKRSFRSPDANDWALRKIRTENGVEKSGLTLGAYIYQHLLSDPSGKIIGKFVETVNRSLYKDELTKILQKQAEFHEELNDKDLLRACSEELYANNEARRESLRMRDVAYLLIEDVLFYQRPLKSKKSLISNCPYESHQYVDKETGEIKVSPIKCIAKSNPYFQEFRLLQFMQNLRIYDVTGMKETEVTGQYLPDVAAWGKLYCWLNNRETVTQDAFLKDFLGIKKPKGKDTKYPLRWNYVEDKKYPAGDTHTRLKTGLEKAGLSADLLNDAATEYRLWHLMYSIDDVEELKGALQKFADVYQLDNQADFIDVFSKMKPFDKEYGSYSEKAIKKLLPLVKAGKRVHEACYEVYGRYSEGLDTAVWKTPAELRTFVQHFPNLRNPIVQQCIMETLRTVADIWESAGHIDEIHLELARDLKNPADKRKSKSEEIQRNENTNLRIKALLLELLNDPNVIGVHPNSPMQQDILRLYEEGALLELKPNDPDYKEILSISQMAQPSDSQLTRYKLWLEQRYRSPYTGKVIPLGKLFTPAYQIEHVIPRSRYYDDSLMNKVICEAEVNKDKTNFLAHEYIALNQGKMIETVSGTVKLFNLKEYEEFVREHYANLKPKRERLMLDDVPEEFISRQMNDSRYISKVVKSLLSNIVREPDEDEDISKNVIVCMGKVTDRLKEDWGLKHVWNHLVYPRYERLNQLTGTELFGKWENKDGKRVFQTSMPLELQRGYQKKRIDHRHHAMDALVIACASRNIVNLLSNQHANHLQEREDLKRLLTGRGGLLNKPWDTFTQDAEQALASIVMSFKNRVRVLTQGSNYYDHYNADGKKEQVAQKGENQKVIRKPLHQASIYGHVNLRRKKMFSIDVALSDVKNIVDRLLRDRIIDLFSQGNDKKTIKKKLQEEGIGKQVELYYYTDDANETTVAKRSPLNTTFNEKKIKTITDTGIQKILLNYLLSKNNDPAIAFTPDGIEEMNSQISKFNGGKNHQPIYNVRLSVSMGARFPIGKIGAKAKQFVATEEGTNLFFAVYELNGKREFRTIPIRETVECLLSKQPVAPLINENGYKLLFVLNPMDLVYIPNPDEKEAVFIEIAELDPERIYQVVKFWDNRIVFAPHRIANLLLNVKDNKGWTNPIINEVSLTNDSGSIEKFKDSPAIKHYCWKLEVNRLGEITKIIR